MISALIKRWWRDVADAVEAGRLTLITSPEAIDEFLDVVSRPQKQPLIEAADAAQIADLLRHATIVVPADIGPICRDPNDDFLLALAKDSDADVLVSRDEDLLSLRKHHRTEIIHVAEFLRRIAPPATTPGS